MGVRTGLRPLQGAQKRLGPYVGCWAKIHKNHFCAQRPTKPDSNLPTGDLRGGPTFFSGIEPKKGFIKVLSGTFLAISPQNRNMTLKTIDSGLENKHFPNLRKKLD